MEKCHWRDWVGILWQYHMVRCHRVQPMQSHIGHLRPGHESFQGAERQIATSRGGVKQQAFSRPPNRSVVLHHQVPSLGATKSPVSWRCATGESVERAGGKLLRHHSMLVDHVGAVSTSSVIAQPRRACFQTLCHMVSPSVP